MYTDKFCIQINTPRRHWPAELKKTRPFGHSCVCNKKAARTKIKRRHPIKFVAPLPYPSAGDEIMGNHADRLREFSITSDVLEVEYPDGTIR
jgi:hypothetical protein